MACKGSGVLLPLSSTQVRWPLGRRPPVISALAQQIRIHRQCAADRVAPRAAVTRPQSPHAARCGAGEAARIEDPAASRSREPLAHAVTLSRDERSECFGLVGGYGVAGPLPNVLAGPIVRR